MNNDFLILFNDISRMNGGSLLEKILDYCETYNRDILEIADILSDSKEFKEMFYEDCVKNNIIRNPQLKSMMERTEVIDEW